MKRRYYRSYAKDEPGAAAWFVLFLAWLCVLPVAAFVFRPVETAAAETEPVFQQVGEQPEPYLPAVECSYRNLPALSALRTDKPTILIYHTHTTEAYTQTEADSYKEDGEWRTKDNTQNIVAVGEVLKEILEKDYGFRVIHDTTDHEPPKLSTAYERSLLTMEKYHREYPSIVLFIDLHRDAYTTDSAPCDFLTINGTETAKLMLVVGKGEKYDDKPYYASNVAFAQRITDYLNSVEPKLCRPVRIKTGRYNQHVTPNCILVEVGHNANTLAQAKAAMPYLAESIVYAFLPGTVEQTDWVSN